jgi:hypothetical protein
MSMFHVAIILFALAAVFGLTMAVLHFKGQTPPKPMQALAHGVFAASGLAVLLVAVLQTGAEGARGAALGLFLVAALGGFALLSFHLRGRALPNGLVAGHGLIAVIAFLTLLYAVFATAT